MVVKFAQFPFSRVFRSFVFVKKMEAMLLINQIYSGAEPETIGRGARVKEIERPGQKKLYFLLHKLYFSVNQEGTRASADIHLSAVPEYI
jgi:hypothetical protein